MVNWKTTLSGILALAPQLIANFSSIMPAPIANLLTAIMVAIGFFLAKDAGVTGAAK